MASFTISLNKLRFFANHGVFEEERLTGNEFEVNISLRVKAPKETVRTISETINYAEVYSIVQNIFANREELLETIAMNIAKAVKDKFPALKQVSITISKLHPPITSFTGSVSVKYSKKFKV